MMGEFYDGRDGKKFLVKRDKINGELTLQNVR